MLVMVYMRFKFVIVFVLYSGFLYCFWEMRSFRCIVLSNFIFSTRGVWRSLVCVFRRGIFFLMYVLYSLLLDIVVMSCC